jgi:hypothetical protein
VPPLELEKSNCSPAAKDRHRNLTGQQHNMHKQSPSPLPERGPHAAAGSLELGPASAAEQLTMQMDASAHLTQYGRTGVFARSLVNQRAPDWLTCVRSTAWPSSDTVLGSSRSLVSSGFMTLSSGFLSCSRLGLRTSMEAVVTREVRERGPIRATCEVRVCVWEGGGVDPPCAYYLSTVVCSNLTLAAASSSYCTLFSMVMENESMRWVSSPTVTP